MRYKNAKMLVYLTSILGILLTVLFALRGLLIP